MWHCMKRIRIQSFSGPLFPAFRLNTDQKNSEYALFSRSVGHYLFIYFIYLFNLSLKLTNKQDISYNMPT